jgi:Protein of unknown function (DUF3349)
MNGMLNKVVAWFRAGYPTGAPQSGHAALLALCGHVAGVGVAGGASGGSA